MNMLGSLGGDFRGQPFRADTRAPLGAPQGSALSYSPGSAAPSSAPVWERPSAPLMSTPETPASLGGSIPPAQSPLSLAPQQQNLAGYNFQAPALLPEAPAPSIPSPGAFDYMGYSLNYPWAQMMSLNR